MLTDQPARSLSTHLSRSRVALCGYQIAVSIVSARAGNHSGLSGQAYYGVMDRVLKRVVALTGWGQTQDQQRTREAGFDVHLLKPINRGQLENVLAASPASVMSAAHKRQIC